MGYMGFKLAFLSLSSFLVQSLGGLESTERVDKACTSTGS